MEKFSIATSTVIVYNLIETIQDNKQYLSEIDGATGDGDHGINMSKGFGLCKEELDKNPVDLRDAMQLLSKILLMRIGGSMGPLYGKFFKAIAVALDGETEVDKVKFGQMIQTALDSITTISQAKVGDKTLMDCLIPAVEAYDKALLSNLSFTHCLTAMKKAAIEGRDSTIDLTAKLGRASRLGERSRGVLDAGATSCCLILCSMADTINELLLTETVNHN